jgi:hypothetical protein
MRGIVLRSSVSAALLLISANATAEVTGQLNPAGQAAGNAQIAMGSAGALGRGNVPVNSQAVLPGSPAGATRANQGGSVPADAEAGPLVTRVGSNVGPSATFAPEADRWRYQWYDAHWWYWTPDNRWMYWNGNIWASYYPDASTPNVTRGDGVAAPCYSGDTPVNDGRKWSGYSPDSWGRYRAFPGYYQGSGYGGRGGGANISPPMM